MTRRPLAAIALALLAACGGGSPKELSEQAQAELNKGHHAEARKLAEAGLAAGGADKNLAWTLERVRLEALAGQGDGAGVTAGLEKLTASYPDKVNADLYAKLGRELSDAGKSLDSLALIEAGKKKFPDKAVVFDSLIEDLKAKAEAGDNALLSQLQQLGYIGGK